MIGFHLQQGVPNWLGAIVDLPENTPFLAVEDYQLCREAKQHNSGLFTIFRKHTLDQSFTPDYEEAKNKARRYFDSAIDGTWQQQEIWRYVDAFKEWNEYVSTSQNEAERQLIITWLQAVNHVWNTEYRGTPKLGGRDIPLVCVSCPIGNDIDYRFAKIVYESDNILSYHGYTHFYDGERDPEDWRYHSGRWVTMDTDFKRRGINVKWIATESGPYFGVYDGWKDPRVLNGDLQRYIDECIRYQIDRIRAWNPSNGDRFLGAVLFTTGGGSRWSKYELNAHEMKQIAEFVRDYAPIFPPPPPPPPPPSITPLERRLWDESVRRQMERYRAIQLNPHGALQQYIADDGGAGKQHVTEEFRLDNHAAIAAENAITGKRYLYYVPVDDYNRITRLYGHGATLEGRG